MRAFRCVNASVTAVMFVASSGAVSAQVPQNAQAVQQEIEQLRSEFEMLRQQYGDRLSALEARLTALQEGQKPPQPGQPPTAATGTQQPPAGGTAPTAPTAQVPTGAEGAGGPSGTLPVYGAAVAGSKIFNPDLAVIGAFLGATGHNTVAPDPTFAMHESEASFQAIVDPYARADFFLSFGEEGVNLEEGFLTFTSLPGGLLTKVGKMRAAFGKVNGLHNHVLPWTDRPLVFYNLVGGEDGISDAGLSVARLIPNPWLFLEATGQVLRGASGADNSPLFQTTRRNELSYVGHLRAYQDITEDTNIDLGYSYSRGHNGLFVNGA